MEQEETRGYNEPCAECSVVDWGITDEGRFYCRSCHTVIERTREVITGDATSNARAQSIARGLKRKNKFDKGWEWYICEGFQFILWKQAEALQSLGVPSQFKDEVLCNLWRRYLQKSNQAYCDKPHRHVIQDTLPTQSTDTETESELDIRRLLALASSASDTDAASKSSVTGASSTSRMSGKSGWSGSVDGGSNLQRRKKWDLSMSMPMTLAFCYLALLWLRESITLSDLIRLVMDGHIPYLNAFKDFPEEMKMYGSDFKIFHVQSWPTYEKVHKKMHALAKYIELPCFPEISERSFLHPNILCMKYLMEVNLPDDIHNWACRVIKRTGIGDKDFLTLRPGNEPAEKVKYDILAVATVIVVLKILFLLDDQFEWFLADCAEEQNKDNKGCPVFDIRKWYMVVKKVLDEKQKKFNEDRIRYLWRCEKPLIYTACEKHVVFKKKRMAMDLQKQFRTLSGTVELPEKPKPSAFQLNWTEENAQSDCFYGHSLAGILQQKDDISTTLNRNYWLGTTNLCKEWMCGRRAHYKESDFPHTYRFMLNLFSFLLRVQPSLIHEEVCVIEHKLFNKKLHKKSRIFKIPKSEML
ncbi:TATA box-binding protein-associated factor RNA polymerase I subunit B [Pogona vitticeps]